MTFSEQQLKLEKGGATATSAISTLLTADATAAELAVTTEAATTATVTSNFGLSVCSTLHYTDEEQRSSSKCLHQSNYEG